MDFVRSCFTFSLVALLSAVGLVACDQGTAPIGDRNTATQPYNQTAIEIEPAEEFEPLIDEDIALVATEVEEEVLWDSGLIVNGSFEEWERNRPVGWTPRQVRRSDDAVRGDYSAQLISEGYASLVQYLQNSEQLVGKEIKASATVKAFDGYDIVRFSLRYQLDEKWVIIESRHSGSGDWENLEIGAEIPQDADHTTIHVRLVLMETTEGEQMALIDEVGAWIIDN